VAGQCRDGGINHGPFEEDLLVDSSGGSGIIRRSQSLIETMLALCSIVTLILVLFSPTIVGDLRPMIPVGNSGSRASLGHAERNHSKIEKAGREVHGSGVVFYVAAHQDDWELFLGERAFADLQMPDLKIVFIYTTAGDAGRTDGWWEAREQGAVAAARVAMPQSPLRMDIAGFRGHPILRYSCGNSVSYFLRLPDGDIRTGKGYAATGFQSLEQLRDNTKPVTAVDRSTTYATWQDFCLTLKAIVESEKERAAVAHPRINAGDYDAACDPEDHYDHRATADALRTFAAGTYERVWWVGYDTRNRPENLSSPALENKKVVFFGYGKEVLNQTTLNGNPAQPSEEEWKLWGARSYYRVVPFDKPDPDKPDCK
jgi:hypothetical protein